MRSVWVLVAGAFLTLWYAGRVWLLSYVGTEAALGRSCGPAARNWSRAILRLAGITVEVEGADALESDDAYVIVCNHESWCDVWAVAGWLPIDARFVVKRELAWIPVFGRAWQKCGHIAVDRGHRESAKSSLAMVGRQIHDQRLHMVMFAEGTRSSDGELQPFKKGPFVLAIQAGAPVIPAAILGSGPLMPKGSFRIRPGKILIRVGRPIAVTGMEHADRNRLRDMTRDAVARLRAGTQSGPKPAGGPPLEDHVESPKTTTNP